ncbi:folyl-polyglutamate synthetase [Streptococcus macacae NCTC 11558]|nr:folyl-polyglutamate synthetase [Streptococcus macacae NCTC 11558]
MGFDEMEKKLTYQEALNWIQGNLKFGIKPGLDRMSWMLKELGNPQENINGIHVVGTNGKGSTVHYLQTIFSQAGYEVGTFTSPYIVDFRERIAINGNMIRQEDLMVLVQLVSPVVKRLPLETSLEPATEFEIITLMMFLYFGKLHPVDLVIVEAGLGGLYDSTNVFKAQAVICTSIGLDHQNILGTDYIQIAQQKVGVLKNKVPFIFNENRTEVEKVFCKQAEQTQSPIYQLGKEFSIVNYDNSFDFIYGKTRINDIQLAMKGQHQYFNAALSIMTCLLLQEKFPQVTQNIIKQALGHSRWIGRIEFIRDNLIIDGAHNKESITVLIDFLKKEYPTKKIHILFAAIDTKPIETMLSLLEQFNDLTVTSFEHPNAICLESYPEKYERVADFKDWLPKWEAAEPNDLFVITGSLYFIAQVRKTLLQSQTINRNK